MRVRICTAMLPLGATTRSLLMPVTARTRRCVLPCFRSRQPGLSAARVPSRTCAGTTGVDLPLGACKWVRLHLIHDTNATMDNAHRIAEIAGLIQQLSAELAELIDAATPVAHQSRSESLTQRMRSRLVDSHQELLDEFGDDPFRQSVLQHWYQKNFQITEEENYCTGSNYKPRWIQALSSAIEDNRCPVIQKIGRDSYIVTPAEA